MSGISIPDVTADPSVSPVDPQALAALMPALERLIRIGVYYPRGHAFCDRAADDVRQALAAVAGRGPAVEFESQRGDLDVQGVDLEPTLRGVDTFQELLTDAGIVAVAVDVDIATDALPDHLGHHHLSGAQLP